MTLYPSTHHQSTYSSVNISDDAGYLKSILEAGVEILDVLVDVAGVLQELLHVFAHWFFLRLENKKRMKENNVLHRPIRIRILLFEDPFRLFLFPCLVSLINISPFYFIEIS